MKIKGIIMNNIQKSNLYFISVQRIGKAPAWIRMPFQTKVQLQVFMKEYSKNSEIYENLQIFNEQLLDTYVSINVDGKDEHLTLREYFFGASYEEYAKDVKEGVVEV